MPATLIPSPVGPLQARSPDGALIALSMHRRLAAGPDAGDPAPSHAPGQLDAHLAGALAEWALPLALQANPCERGVWAALLEIPSGGTTPYGEPARRIGAPTAARAVGLANSRNPV